MQRWGDTSFRRTLVGLKPTTDLLIFVAGLLGFRRTLVGLKLVLGDGEGGGGKGFRRTLVGLKLPYHTPDDESPRVSDVPVWG